MAATGLWQGGLRRGMSGSRQGSGFFFVGGCKRSPCLRNLELMRRSTDSVPGHILAQCVVQRSENAVNTSVLCIVATGMDACDNVSCSTFLHSVLYKEAKTR